MPDDQKNYFKLLEDDKKKSFEWLLFAQLARCMFVGSLDKTNPGKVFIQDTQGNAKEIVREDNKDAFINSVNMLYYLLEQKLDKETLQGIKKNPDYDQARENFRIILKHIHRKSPIFGSKEAVIFLGKHGTDKSKPEK